MEVSVAPAELVAPAIARRNYQLAVLGTDPPSCPQAAATTGSTILSIAEAHPIATAPPQTGLAAQHVATLSLSDKPAPDSRSIDRAAIWRVIAVLAQVVPTGQAAPA